MEAIWINKSTVMHIMASSIWDINVHTEKCERHCGQNHLILKVRQCPEVGSFGDSHTHISLCVCYRRIIWSSMWIKCELLFHPIPQSERVHSVYEMSIKRIRLMLRWLDTMASNLLSSFQHNSMYFWKMLRNYGGLELIFELFRWYDYNYSLLPHIYIE